MHSGITSGIQHTVSARDAEDEAMKSQSQRAQVGHLVIYSSQQNSTSVLAGGQITSLLDT